MDRTGHEVLSCHTSLFNISTFHIVAHNASNSTITVTKEIKSKQIIFTFKEEVRVFEGFYNKIESDMILLIPLITVVDSRSKLLNQEFGLKASKNMILLEEN